MNALDIITGFIDFLAVISVRAFSKTRPSNSAIELSVLATGVPAGAPALGCHPSFPPSWNPALLKESSAIFWTVICRGFRYAI
jgi:hypothetical protein